MNNLADLGEALFEQLNRVKDSNLAGSRLDAEIKRSNVMIGLGQTIIKNGDLMLKATQMQKNCDVPKMLEGKES